MAFTFTDMLISLICCTSLYTGFFILSPNSFYPLALPILKLTLAITTSLSVTYALVFRSPSPDNISEQRHYLFLAFFIIPVHFLIPYLAPHITSYEAINASVFGLLFCINSVWIIVKNPTCFQLQQFFMFLFYWLMQGTLFLTMMKDDKFSWHIVMLISITISSFWEPNSDIQLLISSLAYLFQFLERITKTIMPLSWQKIKDFFKNSRIDLWVALLSQIYFPSSTSYEVSARMLLVLSWVASLALLSASHDFGISNTLLMKMILISVIQIVHLDQSRFELMNAWINVVAGFVLIGLNCWITSEEFRPDKVSSDILPVFINSTASVTG